MTPRKSASLDVSEMILSFVRSLRAENKSERTVTIYGGSVRAFRAYLESRGEPTDLHKIERRHVEGFITDQLARRSPNTAASRYRNLRRFFNWLLEEGELERSPMVGMREPTVPEIPVEIVTPAEMAALFKATAGNGFLERRDHALILMMYDTGLRASELVNLRLGEVDLDQAVAVVLGKGRRPRATPFGKRTTRALDRYLRSRRQHAHADSEAFWLGQQGPLTMSGLEQLIKRRGRQAGIEGLHPHRFRHSFASSWLADGGQEGDLMFLGGWKSRDVMGRYGAATAAARAQDAHRKRSPGDRL
jgi:site-specific recombinase XerD